MFWYGAVVGGGGGVLSQVAALIVVLASKRKRRRRDGWLEDLDPRVRNTGTCRGANEWSW